MPIRRRSIFAEFGIVVGMGVFVGVVAAAEGPVPVVRTVFPAGAQAGQSVEVTLTGESLATVRTLRLSIPGATYERLDDQRYRLAIPAHAPTGSYDLWAVGETGISAPSSFVVGDRSETVETEPNDSPEAPMTIGSKHVINGRIGRPGDVDHYRFEARKGQTVVIECHAERIDSPLRAILELFDSTGRRVAVNRGHFGVDPQIVFAVPAEGAYVAKISDLTGAGSDAAVYRLEVDTGPRVLFTVPNAVRIGQSARLKAVGWNLKPATTDRADSTKIAMDEVEVDLPASAVKPDAAPPIRMSAAQAAVDGFSYRFPGSAFPVFVGVTDVPVVRDSTDRRTADKAQPIEAPCEISGALADGKARAWYALTARRGEVFHFEAFADRIGSPMDLRLSVFDEKAEHELASFGDVLPTALGLLPLGHLDPVGRWAAPADGRFLIALKNLTGGLQPDPRRRFRLSVRREEPDFRLTVVPIGATPAALVVPRGGRATFEVAAIRLRGFSGAIRVSAQGLPTGLKCPDVTIGPGVDCALMVVSCERETAPLVTELRLFGEAEGLGSRPARAAVLVRNGSQIPAARLVSSLPLAVSGDAPLEIIADAHEPLKHQLYGTLPARHSPGGMVDVAVRIVRKDTAHQAATRLTVEGLPESIGTASATIPGDSSAGYVSFPLPLTLPVGSYSFVVRAETTVPTADPKKPTAVVAYSEPMTIDVQPAVFAVEVDPFAVTRAKRGETIQISYKVRRRNGFIGKTHTELAMPGLITDVVGLRGRGETFVGQTEQGSLQIVVNDDAPLGRVPFLRLFTVGTVEDEPIFQGAGLLNLEIVE
jgi:hypothetical protein